MAERFLFYMIEKLIGKLGSVAVESWNVRDDVEKMVENMYEIKAVVYDAEEQQHDTNNHQVQLWLVKLKDALDDIDDLLDDFYTEDKRRHVMTKDKKAKKVRIFFSSSNQLLFSFKMAHKIKDLRKTIEALNVNSKIFNFTNRTPELRTVKQRETHSFIREEEVIGREEEKKDLVELLLNTDPGVKENVSIISIIGIGGLGKTALAQLVYNDQEVHRQFELKKWVCVSDNFDVKGIAAKIVESKTNDEMDQVQQELRKKVLGMRYLFVLDDIWNEDREHWLQLMTLLVDGAKGSKIIITTRSEKVAKISSTSSLFFLKGLDEKQSWKLFSQLAFENGKEPENHNLVSIGKQIVKKCSGVPLAIRSIGSLMYSMERENDWSNFKNKDLMKIDEQGGNTILQLIKLSYDHLPFHLKKCFAFCSLFPNDYEINKATLIRLWIAEGFVQSSDESLEDTGDKYFMTLVHRSFFHDFTTDMFGDILYFKIHDLVYDLARFISRNEYVMVNEKGQHIDKQTRHVSFGFVLDSSWHVSSSLLKSYKLRTFLLQQYNNLDSQYYEASLEESACNLIMTSFKQFRVLNLNHINSRKIPSSIGMLKHLRYLDLSDNTQIKVLPRSIARLNNLETLLLNGCSMLRELPKDVWKLTSLRHLELYGCENLTFMPRGIGKLTDLQTLTQFIFDTTSKHSAGASELKELNNLRNELEIKGLECLRRSPIEAMDMNLMGKSHLQRLSLAWGEETDGDDSEMDKDDIILQGLIHPNIKVLVISGFGGVTFSSSVNSFPNLKELSLTSCARLQYLPQLHVKSLSLENLPCLEWIVNDINSDGSTTTFPPLTDICLYELLNLKGWCRCSEEELQMGCCHQFKSLDDFRIYNCPNLISIPQHTNIRTIVLYNVKEKILQQAVNYSKVEYLEIEKIDNLKSLSGIVQHLTTLVELRIRDCKELDLCNNEDDSYSMEWKELKNLKRLVLSFISKMESLPEGLEHVTTLQSLTIENCDDLTCIPEWVTSLQVLKIEDCPKLTSLPEGVEVKTTLI